ncbi:MAG: hypothetical protein HY319_00635 [Armatimonadetes bacterium]|nr:hypothetical protein [Armatimonadota bacterium]
MIERFSMPGLAAPPMELLGRVKSHRLEANQDSAHFHCSLDGVDIAWRTPAGASATEVDGRCEFQIPGGLKQAAITVRDRDANPDLQVSLEREYSMSPPNVLTIVNPGAESSRTLVRIPLQGLESSHASFPGTGVQEVRVDPVGGEIQVLQGSQEHRYSLRNGVLTELHD